MAVYLRQAGRIEPERICDLDMARFTTPLSVKSSGPNQFGERAISYFIRLCYAPFPSCRYVVYRMHGPSLSILWVGFGLLGLSPSLVVINGRKTGFTGWWMAWQIYFHLGIAAVMWDSRWVRWRKLSNSTVVYYERSLLCSTARRCLDMVLDLTVHWKKMLM